MNQRDENPGWDSQALQEVSAAGYADVVILTDRNGRILHSTRRRSTPEPLGALLDMSLASHAAAGRRFGLGELELAASVHESGSIVCGRTKHHSIVILASEEAKLGQLLRHVRRVFPQRAPE